MAFLAAAAQAAKLRPGIENRVNREKSRHFIAAERPPVDSRWRHGVFRGLSDRKSGRPLRQM